MNEEVYDLSWTLAFFFLKGSSCSLTLFQGQQKASPFIFLANVFYTQVYTRTQEGTSI